MDGLRLGTSEGADAKLRESEGMISNESRVREIRTLGSLSGERNRGQGGDRGTGTGARAAAQQPLRPRSKRKPLRDLTSETR